MLSELSALHQLLFAVIIAHVAFSQPAPKNKIPADCADVLEANPTTPSGMQTVQRFTLTVNVDCDMETAGGGWELISLLKDNNADGKLFTRTSCIDFVSNCYGFVMPQKVDKDSGISQILIRGVDKATQDQWMILGPFNKTGLMQFVSLVQPVTSGSCTTGGHYCDKKPDTSLGIIDMSPTLKAKFPKGFGKSPFCQSVALGGWRVTSDTCKDNIVTVGYDAVKGIKFGPDGVDMPGMLLYRGRVPALPTETPEPVPPMALTPPPPQAVSVQTVVPIPQPEVDQQPQASPPPGSSALVIGVGVIALLALITSCAVGIYFLLRRRRRQGKKRSRGSGYAAPEDLAPYHTLFETTHEVHSLRSLDPASRASVPLPPKLNIWDHIDYRKSMTATVYI